MNRPLSRLARPWFALVCLVSVSLSLSAVPAMANDLRPPAYRFDPLSTVAGWDFLTDQEVYSIRPDADVPLVIGDVAPALNTEFPTGAPYPSAAIFGSIEYTPLQGGGYVGNLPGERGLVFVIPNFFDEQLLKRLRLQVTYQGAQPPTAVVGYPSLLGNPKDVEVIPVTRVPVQDPSLPAGSEYFYEDWRFFSSSLWEQVIVFLPEETTLQHVVIDTVIESAATYWIFENQYEPHELAPWKPPK